MASQDQKTAFSIGMETTYNDGGAAFTYLPVFVDAKPELQKEIHEADYWNGSLGRAPFIVGTRYSTLPFKTYLKGSGAAGTAPEQGKLLRICGLAQTINAGVSVVYTPRDTGYESATLPINLDGIEHKLGGARGFAKLPILAGKPVLMEGTITGLYNAPTVVAFPTVTYTDNAIRPQIVQSMVLTIGGNTHVMSEFILSPTQMIEPIGNINAANQGINSIDIVGRTFDVSMKIQRDAASDLEYWANMLASTEVAVVSTGFGVAGNLFDVDFNKLQIEDIKIVSDHHLVYYDIKGRINADPTTELSLKYS